MPEQPSPEQKPAEDAWTIGRLLNWTTDFLKGKGVESPRLEAEVLLAYARGSQRIQLYTAFEEPASDALREKFRALVKERAAGKPVAYLVGEKEFYSLPFHVTSDVLIPRPETEELVVRALDLAKETGKPSLEIADVGTGSGILAVCLAKHLPQAALTAIEVSPKALEIASRNATRHAVEDRIDFVESDLFSKLDSSSKFDLIVSNPPYVMSAELAGLDVSVRDYEPRLALDGGEQGTDVITRLIEQATERLNPGGWLLMEIGPSTAAATERLVQAQDGLSLQPTITDAANLPRIVQAKSPTA